MACIRHLSRSLRFSYRLTPKPQHFHSSSPSLMRTISSSEQLPLSLFLPSHRFSSSPAATQKPSSGQKLAGVLQSEIQCAVEEANDAHQEGGLLPEGFPFELIDNPGEETITLKRELDGENIEVVVHMPRMEEQENDDDDDDDEDDKKSGGEFSLSFIVTVIKGEGPHLEFTCSAAHDGFTIDSMLLKTPEDSSKELAYEGPEFSDLDEKLKKEFHGYLERRGIKTSLTNFLHEYMMDKDNKEYTLWLNNMKNFIEKSSS